VECITDHPKSCGQAIGNGSPTGEIGRRAFLKGALMGAAAGPSVVSALWDGDRVASAHAQGAGDAASRAASAAAALARRKPGVRVRILQPFSTLVNLQPVAEQWTTDTGIPVGHIEAHHGPDHAVPGGRGARISGCRGAARGREPSIRENTPGVSAAVWGRHRYARGKGAGPEGDIGTGQWSRGVLRGLRTAMRHFGNQPLTGAQVQWGREHLTLTAVSLKALGAEGLLSPYQGSSRRPPASAPHPLPGATDARRSAAVHLMEALQKALVILLILQCVELISISSLTKRPHAASRARCAVFSLEVCAPVDYHV
jgi:hypothetical protein